jgi:cell fate regulator YaaT (PSP1 superfamily)
MTGPQDVTDTGTEIVHTVHTVHTATSTADEAGSPRTPAGEQLVEVSFKGNRREFFRWTDGDAPALKTPVIVEVERGEDFGVIHATSELALQRKAGTAHGKASPDLLQRVLRLATADDVAKAAHLRADDDNVRKRAIEKVRAQGLEMKVSDTEWQWDKKKLTLYFTAEKRVDFRQLVRQLEGLFGARVQMWHIGVRDEARRLDGIGRCARQYCSASWLPELRPVKSSVAKDQRLSTLNPAQISGTCGRLMCCLRYEHEFYVKQRKRFPKEGKILTTLLGEEKVVSNDIFREQVTMRSVSGETRILALGALNVEIGKEILMATSEFAIPTEDDEDEESELLVETARPSRRDAPRREPRREPPRQQRPPRAPQTPRAPAAPAAPAAPTAPVVPVVPVVPTTPATAGAASAPAPAAPSDSNTEAEAQRRRRRRGRRGGRRGREGGAGETGELPGEPNMPPSAPPTSGN